MLTRQRLLALKAWAEKNLCEGREMKAPGENNLITEIRRQKPRVYLGWWPTMPDQTNLFSVDPYSVCPGILIAPTLADAKNMEEKRFDRYSNIHRPKELGQWFNVNILFSVYEPGIRLPGFADEMHKGKLDITKIKEGTEEGLFTLTDWMDDCISGLIAQQTIPNSDLFLDEASLNYAPYADSGFIVDKRPLYYGFINARFQCYADDRANSSLEEHLK